MPANTARFVVVAAGGTGGHLFPAEALSVALARRGIAVELATDERASRYGNAFPARATHIIPSATVSTGNPAQMLRAGARLAGGTLRALGLFAWRRPAAVIGFGGYPTVPPVVAAWSLRIPTIIHEQNGVLGRANRLLAPIARAIATGFPGALDSYPALVAKAVHTGNPLRPAVIEAAKAPYVASAPGAPFRLVVFGGSQGARVMAEVVPAAIELIPVAVRARLAVVQQAREEDVARTQDTYRSAGVAAEVATFFTDLPAKLAAAHLVISRSGASTVAELAAIGRPAILVPLPHALDQDQRANATMLEKAGGAIRLEQADFTPKRLAAEIAALAAEPSRLAAIAGAARLTGKIDAAERLADLVQRVGGLAN